ncbi:MAG: site-2 protease family protein [Bacteroidales bacterium]|nr:site-2 protease family protein [Clostridium sp.]MCM1202782.1 site-2 protease family protein [Bacteroidales bacterium]
MSTVINVIIALIVFGSIIFFHELGHFLLAKLNGIYVNEFAVGMGPTLVSFKKKETKYSLKLIPMGGYCMMLGEDEEINDEHSFSSKSVWARISVVIAGPVFNFILAFILAIILIAACGYDEPVIDKFSENSPAKAAGMMEGDVITGYNGHRVYNFREVLVYMQLKQDDEAITLTVERNGESREISVSPEKTDSGYLMGVQSGGRARDGAWNVLKYSVLELRYQIKTTVLSLQYLIGGKLGFQNLSGPVGIVSMMSDTIDEAKESADGDTSVAVINVVLNMLNFCILLSANLGVMNLLPIPALDGGRTLFLLVEAIFRKRIPADKEAFVNTIGFMLLIGLMIVVMFQDVLKIMH